MEWECSLHPAQLECTTAGRQTTSPNLPNWRSHRRPGRVLRRVGHIGSACPRHDIPCFSFSTHASTTNTHTHTLPPTRPGLNVLILITPNPRPASAASAFYKKSSIRWILKGLQPFCFGVLSEPLHSMVHGTQKDPKTQVENSYSVGVLNVPYRSRTS